MADHVRNILIVGASGGLGQAFVKYYINDSFCRVITASRSMPVVKGEVHYEVDLEDEHSIQKMTDQMGHSLDLVVFASGFLHGQKYQPEKTYRSIDPSMMQKSFMVNAIGPMLVCKNLLPLIDRRLPCKFIFLGARVGSISDNRLGGWYSYRASKAALHMLVKNLSIEVARTHKQIAIACLHPGTVDTNLSKPFQKNVPEGKLFAPEDSCQKLVEVIENITPEDSGKIFDWAGLIIQP